MLALNKWNQPGEGASNKQLPDRSFEPSHFLCPSIFSSLSPSNLDKKSGSGRSASFPKSSQKTQPASCPETNPLHKGKCPWFSSRWIPPKPPQIPRPKPSFIPLKTHEPLIPTPKSKPARQKSAAPRKKSHAPSTALARNPPRFSPPQLLPHPKSKNRNRPNRPRNPPHPQAKHPVNWRWPNHLCAPI